jgi:uncharacterized protein YecE (DUF72 family)
MALRHWRFSYAAVMGEIRVGTASWTDRTLIASGWYPAEANTPENISEKYGYRYSPGELSEWAAKIRGLAADADTTHVLFNNCYSNYAHVNAQQLADQLST